MSTAPPSPLFTLRGMTSEVYALHFHDKHPHLLISGCGDGLLCVWDLRVRRCVHKEPAHSSSILVVGIADARIWSHGKDGFIKTWELLEDDSLRGPVSAIEVGFASFCPAAVFTREGLPLAATPAADIANCVHVWDVGTSSKPVLTLDCGVTGQTLGPCTAICVDERRLLLYAGFECGTVVCVDINTRKVVFHVHTSDHPILTLSLLPSMDYMVVGGPGRRLFWLKLSPIEGTSELVDEIALPHAGVSSATCRYDGRIFASACWDGSVRVFDSKRLRPLAVLSHHTGSAYALAFAPLNTPASVGGPGMLASGGKDAHIVITSIYPPKEP